MYKFTIKQEQILEGLNLVSPALGSQQSKPILQCFKVELTETGLIISATDESIYASTYIPLDTMEGTGEFCLDTLVYELLKEFSSEPIEFIYDDGKKLTVSQSGREHSPLLIPTTDYPVYKNEGEFAPIDMSPILTALRKGQIAIAADQHKPALQCYDIEPESGTITTTDGQQMTTSTGLVMGGETALPSAKILNVLFPLLKLISTQEDVMAYMTNKRLAVKSDNIKSFVSFSNRNVPPFATAIKKVVDNMATMQPEATVIVDHDELERALKICTIYERRALATASPKPTRLFIEDGKAFLTMVVEGLSDMTEELVSAKTENVVNNTVLSFSASTLLEFLGISESEKVRITLYGQGKVPFMVQEDIGENNPFLYLQMPYLTN